MSEPGTPHRWSEALLRKARAIHSEIGTLHEYARPQALPPEAMTGLFRGHYALLDDLYLNQLPYALAAEGADFFFGYRGATTIGNRAGLAPMNRLFSTLRTQLGGLARAVSEASHGDAGKTYDFIPDSAETEDEGGPLDDLRVGCCLPGLCVGFSSPEGEAGDIWNESFGHLGFAARALVEKGDAAARLANGIADPRVRDASLGALRKFFPAKDRGIEGVELRGLRLGPSPAVIDREAWQRAGELLGKPVAAASGEEAVFTGRLLQIDYELRRFELREITPPLPGGGSSLRCAYPPALDALCEGAARKKIEVRGRAALAKGGVPRLVSLESLKIVAE